MKICIVSSCGGHLSEVRCLKKIYGAYPHFYVINQRIELADDMRDNTHFIVHSERDWKLIVNLWEAFRVLYRERPSVILSTGAGPAVPFALVGRVLFGCRVVFIESITRVTGPSLTGRIMYLLAHDFFYQWRPLQRFFPRAKYGGPLL